MTMQPGLCLQDVVIGLGWLAWIDVKRDGESVQQDHHNDEEDAVDQTAS
jgi:hypothetical protein